MITQLVFEKSLIKSSVFLWLHHSWNSAQVHKKSAPSHHTLYYIFNNTTPIKSKTCIKIISVPSQHVNGWSCAGGHGQKGRPGEKGPSNSQGTWCDENGKIYSGGVLRWPQWKIIQQTLKKQQSANKWNNWKWCPWLGFRC